MVMINLFSRESRILSQSSACSKSTHWVAYLHTSEKNCLGISIIQALEEKYESKLALESLEIGNESQGDQFLILVF